MDSQRFVYSYNCLCIIDAREQFKISILSNLSAAAQLCLKALLSPVTSLVITCCSHNSIILCVHAFRSTSPPSVMTCSRQATVPEDPFVPLLMMKVSKERLYCIQFMPQHGSTGQCHNYLSLSALPFFPPSLPLSLPSSLLSPFLPPSSSFPPSVPPSLLC